jgi:hypothetical protein
MKAKIQMMTGITWTVTIAQNVKDALPKFLIDYLISILQIDREKAGSWQVFRSSKNKLSNKELQEIVLTGENKVPALHRVFGYNPINAEIIVACDGVGYHMAMTCNV